MGGDLLLRHIKLRLWLAILEGYGTCPRGTANIGKTTLLEVLAGKHMVGRDAVRILGRPAFYDLMLVTSGELGYLGNQWRRSVACAGSSLTLQVLLRGRLPCCGQLS